MKQKDVLIIVILLFIFVLVWIIESIYHSGASSTISESTNQDIVPINATFDTKTIDKLKSREKIVPVFELKSISPTPIALPTQIISPQKASEGGKLLL